MDDVTVLVQDHEGGQILLDDTQEFEKWSNTKLNLSKTVVVDIDGGSGEVDPPKLTYNQQPIRVFQATESCRHLGFWVTTNGNMVVTTRKYQMGTSIRNQTALSGHNVSISMSWESNGLKR